VLTYVLLRGGSFRRIPVSLTSEALSVYGVSWAKVRSLASSGSTSSEIFQLLLTPWHVPVGVHYLACRS